jgi:hypothetical protein
MVLQSRSFHGCGHIADHKLLVSQKKKVAEIIFKLCFKNMCQLRESALY